LWILFYLDIFQCVTIILICPHVILDDDIFVVPSSSAGESERPHLAIEVVWTAGRIDKLNIYRKLVLENHLHLIAGSPRIGRGVQHVKSYTARRIIDQLVATRAQRFLDLLALFKRLHKTQPEHQLWDEGSHPQHIESEGVMRRKLEYIHRNPVKRGFVDLPVHWRWSSARDDAGLAGLIEVDRGMVRGAGGLGSRASRTACLNPKTPETMVCPRFRSPFASVAPINFPDSCYGQHSCTWIT
jgi:putative transposase